MLLLDERSETTLKNLFGEEGFKKINKSPSGDETPPDDSPPAERPPSPGEDPPGGDPPHEKDKEKETGAPPKGTDDTETGDGDEPTPPEEKGKGKPDVSSFDKPDKAILNKIDGLSDAIERINETLVEPMLKEKVEKKKTALKAKLKNAYESEDQDEVDRLLEEVSNLEKEKPVVTKKATVKKLQERITSEEQGLIDFYKSTYPKLMGTEADKELARSYYNLLASVEDPKIRAQQLSSMITTAVNKAAETKTKKKPAAPRVSSGRTPKPEDTVNIKEVPRDLYEHGKKLKMSDEKIVDWYKSFRSKDGRS